MHNDEKPLVSICCITYNQEKYIAQCLDGFLMQKTTFPFEIVISNDCSTDNTKKIIDSYLSKYPAIFKDVSPQQNIGMNKNFHHVLEKASGKYIAYCEGDDYWIDENKLQMQVDFLENNPEYGMCFTNFNIYQQNKMEFNLLPSKKINQDLYESIEYWILEKGYIAPMTWMFKKCLLESYTSVNTCDETFVLVALFIANSKIKYISDKITAVYRQLNESASHSLSLEKKYIREKKLLDTQIMLIRMYDLPNDLIIKCFKKFYDSMLMILIVLNEQKELLNAKYFKYTYFKNKLLRLVFFPLFRIFISKCWLRYKSRG